MKIIKAGLTSKKRVPIVVLCLCTVLCLSVLFSVAYQNSRGKAEAAGSDYLYSLYGESAAPTKPMDTPKSNRGVLVLGKDYDTNRTDAIICVCFNREKGGISTLQIPRDTYVTDGDYEGRINGLLPRYKTAAAEAGADDPMDAGIKQLMAKIKADFGVDTQNYVFLDSKAVAALTDALGGVTIDVPMDIDYTDEKKGIDLHLKEGVQRLDGKTAAQFIRYRQGYPQADLGRINAQKLYAAGMLDKLMGFNSLANATTVISALAGYVKTDLRAEDIIELGTELCMTKKSSIVMYTLPGNGVTVNGGSYYGTYRELAAEIVNKAFGEASVYALKVPDFYATVDGGYTDTEGLKLSSVIDYGISIPVYAN